MQWTDGLPNTLVYNFYATPGTTSTLALNTGSGCQDSTGNSWGHTNGWRTSASAAQWLPAMDAERREVEYDNWHRAVERAFGWIKPSERIRRPDEG